MIAACQPSGWIQLEIFTKWFQHFIVNVKLSPDEPTLLVTDGCYFHMRNVEIVEMAQANGFIIVRILPHFTHKMQPLDVSFMNPCRTFYGQEIENLLKHQGNRNVTTFKIGELMGNEYLQSATAQVTVNGFMKTSLYLHMRIIFNFYEFTEDAIQSSISSSSQSFIAPSVIIPVPHLQKCSPQTKDLDTSATLMTGSPHKYKLAENNDREREKK